MIQWYYYHKVILILLQTAPAPQGKLMKRYLIHSQAISVPLHRIEKKKTILQQTQHHHKLTHDMSCRYVFSDVSTSIHLILYLQTSNT